MAKQDAVKRQMRKLQRELTEKISEVDFEHGLALGFATARINAMIELWMIINREQPDAAVRVKYLIVGIAVDTHRLALRRLDLSLKREMKRRKEMQDSNRVDTSIGIIHEREREDFLPND